MNIIKKIRNFDRMIGNTKTYKILDSLLNLIIISGIFIFLIKGGI